MWAMMQKLRICAGSVFAGSRRRVARGDKIYLWIVEKDRKDGSPILAQTPLYKGVRGPFGCLIQHPAGSIGTRYG